MIFNYKFADKFKFIQFETTVLCQANCPFCPQKKVTRRPLRMAWPLIEKLLGETSGAGITYRPFLLNEPFCDNRMIDIVKEIKKDKTARVEFNTNGELLVPELADRLLDAGVDVMRFSVDGITKKTFDESRGINFDKVYANVTYFLKRTRELNYSVENQLRMIKLPNTVDEQAVYAEFWTSKGANVVFTDLYRYPWEGQTTCVAKPCLKILDETFVYVDGRVTLCCWDTNERCIIGDIAQENVFDIWNGRIMAEHRTLLAQGKREDIPLCSRCDAYQHIDFSKVAIAN